MVTMFLHSVPLSEISPLPYLVVTEQSIGSVSRAIGVDHLDIHGILGLGPVDLTKGTLHPKTNALVPTVMNNLKSQERITKEVFSVYIPPMTSSDKTSEYSMSCCWLLSF